MAGTDGTMIEKKKKPSPYFKMKFFRPEKS